MKPGFHFVPSSPSYYIQEFVFSVKKMKKPLMIFIMAIILASVAGAAVFVHAQEDDPATVAENLLNVLNTSSTEINAQFEAYAVNNTLPDHAVEALNQADTFYVEAQAAFDSGDYNSTIELATEALNEYGNAAALLMPVEASELEEIYEVENAYRKLGGYEKALERLDKLYQLASDLELQGVDVLEAVSLLDDAKAVLDELTLAIDEGNLEDVENMVGQANSLMGQTTGLLQSNSGEKRVEKTERFIIQTRLHVSQLETKLNRILAKYNLAPEDDEAIRFQFKDLNETLDGIDPTLDNLKNITRQIQRVVKESHQIGKIEGEVDGNLVEQVNHVSETETKLNRYRERLEELTQLGLNTSEAKELLDQAEELLTNSMDMLEASEQDKANDLLDQADAILDQVDDLFDDMEKSVKQEGKGESDDFDKRVAEIKRNISKYRIEVQNMARKGKATAELETQLDEIEESLDMAETSEDLYAVEQMLEAFEDQLNSDTS